MTSTLLSSISSPDLKSLRTFVRAKIIPASREHDEQETFPLEIFRMLHAQGWLQAFLPQEFGGTQATTADMIEIMREIAYGSPGITTSIAANLLAYVPIIGHALPEIRESVCRDFLERFSLSSFCFTEPDHGSDVLRIHTTATRTEDGYVLNGKKCFVTNGNFAERFVVVARLVPRSGIELHPREAFALFLVSGDSAGVARGAPYRKLGHRDSNTTDIFLDQVKVPLNHLIGNEGEGLKIAFESIQRSRTLLSASAVGLALRAYDLSCDYVNSRSLYDKLLMEQPAIRNALVQMRTDIEASWQLTKVAAANWDSGDRSFAPSSMAKLYCGQMAVRVSGQALELFGGWGYTSEFAIEKVCRDAKLYDLAEGPTFVQQTILARELLKDYDKAAHAKKPDIRTAPVSSRKAA
ncbi:MAG: acyl-CoA/acyl-ACP dehydrogenase [Methylotenera sp.]|nr:acyl-CoA/acyl-ACP dehydrogenase [Oligoflexia bacterium]